MVFNDVTHLREVTDAFRIFLSNLKFKKWYVNEVGRVTTVNAICIITSCTIIMPVDRNRSRLVWSVLTYHPRTYTHSASSVMQQPVCASRTILFVQLVEPPLAGKSPNTIHDQNIEIYIIRYICCSFSLALSLSLFLLLSFLFPFFHCKNLTRNFLLTWMTRWSAGKARFINFDTDT